MRLVEHAHIRGQYKFRPEEGKTVELPFDEELYYNELMKRVATSRRKENVTAVVADTESSYDTTPTGEDKKNWNTNW